MCSQDRFKILRKFIVRNSKDTDVRENICDPYIVTSFVCLQGRQYFVCKITSSVYYLFNSFYISPLAIPLFISVLILFGFIVILLPHWESSSGLFSQLLITGLLLSFETLSHRDLVPEKKRNHRGRDYIPIILVIITIITKPHNLIYSIHFVNLLTDGIVFVIHSQSIYFVSVSFEISPDSTPTPSPDIFVLESKLVPFKFFCLFQCTLKVYLSDPPHTLPQSTTEDSNVDHKF